jgi:ankyrin repeat protein
MQGNTTTVKVLLVIGANVNAKDEEGKTALIYAPDGGHTETVSLRLVKIPQRELFLSKKKQNTYF